MSSNETLLQKRAMLESMLQDYAVAGVPVPPEKYVELATVVHELDTRNVTQIQAKTWMQWLGEKIDGYMLDRLLVEDTYFYLIAAKKIDASAKGDERVVFKIMKEKKLFDQPETARLKNKMQALQLLPFQTVPFIPDANALAKAQYERLKEPNAEAIALPTSSPTKENFFFRIPFINGVLLKEKITRYPTSKELEFTLRTFSDAAGCIDRLKSKDQSFYHGNLKPSNIIATTNGVVFLEPGYHGKLRNSDGEDLESCFVSTLSYYPHLDTDDLLALGISLFECITGVHPFQQSLVLLSIEADFSPTLLDQELRDEINLKRSLLQPYTTPLYKLQRPTFSSTSNAAMIEKCILKGLRLSLGADGLFHKDEGFADFASFKIAIDEILLVHQE
jgi:serine/threonine protein kinase